jgi:hypothetical protein
VLWPLTAVILGAVDVALTMRMLTGLHQIPAASLPSLWRVAVLLLVPLAAGAALAARPGSGRQNAGGQMAGGQMAGGQPAGWRRAVGIPVLVAGLLTAAVAFGCWRSSAAQLPWWACGLVLVLPSGYACAAAVAMYVSAGHGFWPWARFLAGPLFCVGAGQGIVIVAIAIAGQRGFDGVFLGIVTGIAGARLLWFGLYRGGRRLVGIGRGEAAPPVRRRLEDLLGSG